VAEYIFGRGGEIKTWLPTIKEQYDMLPDEAKKLVDECVYTENPKKALDDAEVNGEEE
jgi:hypothetical protein